MRSQGGRVALVPHLVLVRGTLGHRLWEKPRGERQTWEGRSHEPGDTRTPPELGEAGGTSSSHRDLGCLAPRTRTGNTSVVPQPAGLASAAAGLGHIPDGGGSGPPCAPAPCNRAPSCSHVPAVHKHLSPGRETVGRRSERPGRHLVCPRCVPDTCGPRPHAPLPAGMATRRALERSPGLPSPGSDAFAPPAPRHRAGIPSPSANLPPPGDATSAHRDGGGGEPRGPRRDETPTRGHAGHRVTVETVQWALCGLDTSYHGTQQLHACRTRVHTRCTPVFTERGSQRPEGEAPQCPQCVKDTRSAARPHTGTRSSLRKGGTLTPAMTRRDPRTRGSARAA